MPLHYNDAVDDTMVLDRQSSFLGGQLSHIRGNLLNPNQAILLQDVDLETGGTTRTRRGFHAWGDLKALTSSNDVQGVHWFANGNYEYLLAVVNGGLRKMTSAGVWSTVEAATVPASEPAYFAQINDRVFVCAASTARPKDRKSVV